MEGQSLIEFPEDCWVKRDMRYDSIAPLYSRSDPETLGEHLAFAVGCSKTVFQPLDCHGSVQKLEVNVDQGFNSARMRVTHEVLPLQGNCDEITIVNDKLRLACFTNGSILSIKNFGYKKTFNCDVRGRQANFVAGIRATTVSSDGKRVAAASNRGELAIYDIEGDEVCMMQRGQLMASKITGLSFLNPSKGVYTHPADDAVYDGDNMIVFCTEEGQVGLIDARCGTEVIKDTYYSARLATGEPPKRPTAMCLVRNSTVNKIYLGTFHGEILKIDLRNDKKFVYQENFKQEGYVKRMREVVVYDEHSQPKPFIAFANESKEPKILDPSSGKPDSRWKVDRRSDNVLQDFCQIGNRIVTCGKNTSIGCWYWDDARGGKEVRETMERPEEAISSSTS